jgi:Uma2 family endonuclease
VFANLPRTLQILAYEKAAQEYLQSLPLEHFMEATPQAPQRKITLESLDLLALRRPDVQVFNELLVQYPVPGRNKLGQVVPDNMVVLTTERIRAGTSYNVPLEPTPPFWVMEYVSAGSRRKDYEDSFDKYEQDLKVPYYLTFYPDTQDLTLYRHNKRRYVTVKPNRRGRYTIRELDLDVALLDGWVRFWHKGELLPLPADLQRDLDAARRQLVEATRRADEEKRRADELQRRADGEKRRADEEKRRADGLQRRLEAAERQLARGRPENR